MQRAALALANLENLAATEIAVDDPYLTPPPLDTIFIGLRARFIGCSHPLSDLTPSQTFAGFSF